MHLKNYFTILELPDGADHAAIRAAYRRLAKIYHPDGGDQRADEAKFAEITEAYDYLIDPARRRRYIDQMTRPMQNHRDSRLAQMEYEEWLRREKMFAFVRQKKQREKEEEEAFKKTFFYKLIHSLDQAYNVIFLLVFIMVIIIPIYKYIDQQSQPESDQQPGIFFVFPVLLGSLFAVAGYYYWYVYKKREDKE